MQPTRRRFICSVAIWTTLSPVLAAAQQTDRRPRVAFVFRITPVAEMSGADPTDAGARAFVHGLRDLGWIEGRNIVIERYSAEGQYDRLPQLMRELVRRRVDVIVASGPAAEAARDATDRIPIVAWTWQPVESGLISSLGRPGGNVTGVAQEPGPLDTKRLQLLKDVAPTISRVAVIVPRLRPGSTSKWRAEMEDAARTLRLTLVWAEIDSAADLEPGLAAIVQERADAIYPSSGAVVWEHRRAIIDFAARHRLASVAEFREFVEDGGLMYYGASRADNFRRAAAYVDKILKGAKPADLPFEQPAKLELVVNMRTAKAIGLAIPESMLVRADEVIQ